MRNIMPMMKAILPGRDERSKALNAESGPPSIPSSGSLAKAVRLGVFLAAHRVDRLNPAGWSVFEHLPQEGNALRTLATQDAAKRQKRVVRMEVALTVAT